MSLLPSTLARADLWALDLLTDTWRTLIESLTMADTRVGARMTYLVQMFKISTHINKELALNRLDSRIYPNLQFVLVAVFSRIVTF